MKNFHCLLVALLISSLTLVGCFRDNYTNDKAKSIVAQHQSEAVAWFQKNDPQVVLNKDFEPYINTVDLLAAIKGTYKRNGRSYNYVYDYYNQKMYTSEGFEEACKLIGKAIVEDFGYDPKKTQVSIHGYSFQTRNESDNIKQHPSHNGDPQGMKFLRSKQEKLLPAKTTPEAFAQSVLAGREEFPVFLSTFNNNFPTYDKEKLAKYKNLGCIWCFIPIDCEKGFNGIHEKLYNLRGITNYYCHIDKIEEGLYGGYTYHGPKTIQDKLTAKKDKDKIILEIPEAAEPIIFSKNKLALTNYFTNQKGELIETKLDPLYRADCYGNPDSYLFTTYYMVKNNIAYGYSKSRVAFSKGIYNFRLK